MERETHKIDAKDEVLGRLAVQIANFLRGKNKPNFVPYKDMGDFVIVENIRDIKLTGRKAEQKKYYHHSNDQEIRKKTVIKINSNNFLIHNIFSYII